MRLLLLSVILSAVSEGVASLSCYQDEFPITSSYIFDNDKFRDCPDDSYDTCTIIVFERNEKNHTKYSCNMFDSTNQSYCPTANVFKRHADDLLVPIEDCTFDKSRNLKPMKMGREKVECISDRFYMVDGEKGRNVMYCFNSHPWDSRQYHGHGHYPNPVRCVLKDERSVPQSESVHPHTHHGKFYSDPQGITPLSVSDGRYYQDMYLKCHEGFRLRDALTEFKLELVDGESGSSSGYYRFNGRRFSFSPGELSSLCVKDNRTYVKFTKFPQHMLIYDDNGTALHPLGHITTNVTLKCDTERGYISSGTEYEVHVPSWGTRFVFVPANGTTPAVLQGTTYQLTSGDLTQVIGSCTLLKSAVSRKYNLGRKTRVQFNGGFIEDEGIFSADMVDMQLECKNNLDKPVDWESPLRLTFITGDGNTNGYLSPYDFYEKKCDDSSNENFPLVYFDPGRQNIVIMQGDSVLGRGSRVTGNITITCTDLRFMPAGWDSPYFIQYHPAVGNTPAYMESFSEFTCEKREDLFYKVRRIPEHTFLMQHTRVHKDDSVSVEDGPMKIHCLTHNHIPGPSQGRQLTWTEGQELEFKYDSDRDVTITEPDLNLLAPCVPKVCTVDDYKSINFVPYKLGVDGDAVEAGANDTFKYGEVVILRCRHVTGHVNNVMLHAYHCAPNEKHFVKGGLFITCTEYSECHVAYQCQDDDCNDLAATMASVDALCAVTHCGTPSLSWVYSAVLVGVYVTLVKK